MTLKVMAAIHWEALRLWLKGVRLVPRNDAAREYRLGDPGTAALIHRQRYPPRAKDWSRVDRPGDVRVNRRSMIAHARVDFGHTETVDRRLRTCPAGTAGLGFASPAAARHARGDPARRPHAPVRRQQPGPAAAMKSTIMASPGGCCAAATSASPKPICAANGTRPTSRSSSICSASTSDMMQRMLGRQRRWCAGLQVLRHWLNRNTRRQARRNIHAHYDLGNAFYSAWLDPSMTYSSALFEDGTTDLTAAQLRKYRRLAEAIDLKPGQKLLEIGCGWGGFAEYAAKTYGAKVVGLTISREQHDFAQERILEPGSPTRSRSGCRTIATSAAATTASPRSR